MCLYGSDRRLSIGFLEIEVFTEKNKKTICLFQQLSHFHNKMAVFIARNQFHHKKTGAISEFFTYVMWRHLSSSKFGKISDFSHLLCGKSEIPLNLKKFQISPHLSSIEI